LEPHGRLGTRTKDDVEREEIVQVVVQKLLLLEEAQQDGHFHINDASKLLPKFGHRSEVLVDYVFDIQHAPQQIKFRGQEVN
jgi:hypothetical protein